MEFEGNLLDTDGWKNYSFPSLGVQLGTCPSLLPSAAAWHFIIFLMKAGFLCEKAVSVKWPFSAKGTDLSARVTNNVQFPDFLIKFFHWMQGSLLVITVEKWLCCFSLELHRNRFRQKVIFILLKWISICVGFMSRFLKALKSKD